FFSSRRRHTRFSRDWSSDVCSSDLFSLSAGGCNAAYRYRDGLLAGDRLLVERGNTLRQQIEIKALFIAPTHGHTYRRTDPIGSRSEERRVGKECRSRKSSNHYAETQ